MCARNPGSAWGDLEQVTPWHLAFSFFPSRTSQLTTQPREKRISSLKTRKHFEKVKPFTCVQSADCSVKGDVTSGKVRGERKVVSGQETATGKFRWPVWDGRGRSPGSCCLPKPSGLHIPTGRCLPGPHFDTLLSRAKLLPEVVAKTSKEKAGHPLAGSGFPPQPGKAASTHLSEPMGKLDGV